MFRLSTGSFGSPENLNLYYDNKETGTYNHTGLVGTRPFATTLLVKQQWDALRGRRAARLAKNTIHTCRTHYRSVERGLFTLPAEQMIDVALLNKSDCMKIKLNFEKK